MEWAQWALELTRAIAWPLAVVAVLWWLREPIRERLGNVEKVSALGVDLEIAARQRVEKEVRELGDALAEPAQPTVPADTDQEAHDHVVASDDVHADITPAPVASVPSQMVQPEFITPQLTNAQRRAIGELVQQAAEWGRVREQAGLSVDGAHLNWRDGLPTLVTPATPRGTLSPVAARRRNSVINATREAGADAVRRLEATRRLEVRVDELDKERRRAQTGLVSDPTQRLVAEQRYKEAVDRLGALDPDSPYLP